jgi:ribosomal protein S18 acetylase RimI-like enzyme
MKDDYVVRDCRPEDLPRFVELLKVVGLFWATGDSEATFRKKIAHDPGSILVLECAGELIGGVLTTYDPWASFIWHIAIDPAYQGQGLGNRLADEAERRLRERGTTSVNGYVLPSNRNSLSFFKKRGYELFYDPVIPIGKEFD